MKEKNTFLYCTAVVQTTGKVTYEALADKLNELQELTVLEEGCVLFKVVPLNKKQGRFALWEIWKGQAAFYEHHSKEYTKNFFAEELDTVEFFESSEEVQL
ncbi:putative quinol monooxygenase [Enterococcus sp. 5H]|uniref:putative quinol monooxygenase n=1 Tax=Enterococcus sp. 5H TaxID=1229490 RepID=UPI002303299E|nr:antibiotic biosynthesis monooxygenase [Enterococcus sp. 5H]MDA9470649.1 hypothetical protein [Enterococcus sp. 5H]